MAALMDSYQETGALAHSSMTINFRPSEMPALLTARLLTPLTDEQLMLFASENEPCQIERNAEGDLEIMSPQGGKGARSEAFLIHMLDEWTERNGGASFSSQGGFSLPDGSMRMADASWVAEERWEALSEEEKSVYPPLCPDFVIELLSPRDSRPMLESKMEKWVANGAKLAWLIDPKSEEVVIYRTGQEPVRLTRPEAVQAVEVVPGLRIEMRRFWS